MGETSAQKDEQAIGQGAGFRFRFVPSAARRTPDRRLLPSGPAALLMLTLMLAGCAQGPTSPAQASSPPQASNTSTPTGTVPQAAISLPSQTSSVPVTSYVAYASGLATTFTKGNICSMAQPFVLEGEAPPISTGLVANFTPTSATQGNYTFTNNILVGGCADSSSGTYGVTFYSADEGEIIMTGDATRVCKGVTTFSGTTEFRISIRAAPGITCP